MRVLLVLSLLVGMVTCGQQPPVKNWELKRFLSSELAFSRVVKLKIREKVNSLQQFTSKFVKLSSQFTMGSRETYISMPLPALVMIRRLAEEWTALAGKAHPDWGVYQLGLERDRWPTAHHLSMAAYTAMRSQWTYGLDTQELVEGIVSGNKVLYNITAADCFHIGIAYLENNNTKMAIDWFQQALHKNRLGDSSVRGDTVAHYLVVSVCYSGNTAIDNGTKLIDLMRKVLRSKVHTTDQNLLDFYRKMATQNCKGNRNKPVVINEKHILGGFFSSETIEHHRQLCQGKGKLQRNLRCRYLHHNRPHLRLQPFKVEELHLDPLVLRFYDVITDYESEVLKKISFWRLSAAADVRDGIAYYDNFRTSHVAWIFTHESTAHDRLCRRMADMTQLDMREAEASQVSRYCISGEYLTHFDYHEGDEMSFPNNRVASLMFYLNDVKGGGNTIFTRLNLSVSPIKNTAILWFNLTPSGAIDPRSEHSGCPVLQGTKWVLVKWFRSFGQEFKMHCGLHENDSFSRHYVN